MSNTDLGKLSDRDLMAITELASLNDKELLKSLGKAIDGEITQTTLVLRHLILVEEIALCSKSLFALCVSHP
jgi:hypothetical protein